MAALGFAKQFYNCDMAGFSIPATEHRLVNFIYDFLLVYKENLMPTTSMCRFSTITVWREDGEEDAYRNLLEQFPTGPVACVSDSYNIWNACEHIWGEKLHDMVST